MEQVHKASLKDRFKNAYNAFMCKPAQQIHMGIQVTKCDECREKTGVIRDDYLVTIGTRAAYMHDKGLIELPEGVIGEARIARHAACIVDRYINCLVDESFDLYIEEALLEEYGVERIKDYE